MSSNVHPFIYQYKYHLGNVGLRYKKNGSSLQILEEDNYYPFGLKHKGYNTTTFSSNLGQKIKYLGQERQDELGLDWDSFRHRNYDYKIGRFFGVDPIAEQFMSISTYQFAHNNPVWKIELEGLEGQETQGKDISHHEPVKVISPNLGFIGGGLTQMKVYEKATQEVVKETVEREGKSILGTLAKGAATIYALFSNNMAPNYGGRTEEMQTTVSNRISGERVVQDINTRPWGTEEKRDHGEIIYRGGNFADTNFTPRPGKDDGVGPKSGLSTFLDPVKAANMSGSNKAQGLSSKLLEGMGFQLTKTADGHVGIRPPSQTLLQKWASTRGMPQGTNPAEILTDMVKSARVEEVRVPKL